MRTQKNGRGSAPAQANPTDAPASAGEAASATTTAAAAAPPPPPPNELPPVLWALLRENPPASLWRDAIRTVSAGAVNAA